MRPRLGFVGVGWIGRHRLEAIAAAGVAEIAAIADPSRERCLAARAIVPNARTCEHLGELLEVPLDGVVIATPSALHAEQCHAALARGLAVFCQKPLARGAEETRAIVLAARAADRRLGVDLSYRHTAAMQRVHEVVRGGGIGRPFAASLVFHNAYGPDAAWFYQRAAAGGGCLVDLGVHLIDLLLWLLDWPAVRRVDAVVRPGARGDVEDHAHAQLVLDGGVSAQLACSWCLSAGQDCAIELALYGSDGGVAMRNVGGSFYDFTADRYSGTRSERLASPPDAWGGRAIVAWAEALARDPRFDREAERLVDVAAAIDAIYHAGGGA